MYQGQWKAWFEVFKTFFMAACIIFVILAGLKAIDNESVKAKTLECARAGLYYYPNLDQCYGAPKKD